MLSKRAAAMLTEFCRNCGKSQIVARSQSILKRGSQKLKFKNIWHILQTGMEQRLTLSSTTSMPTGWRMPPERRERRVWCSRPWIQTTTGWLTRLGVKMAPILVHRRIGWIDELLMNCLNFSAIELVGKCQLNLFDSSANRDPSEKAEEGKKSAEISKVL